MIKPTLLPRSIRRLNITLGAGHRAAGASPAHLLPLGLCTAEGEWEQRGFPACKAFPVLKAEAGGSQPGAPFPCCPAELQG